MGVQQSLGPGALMLASFAGMVTFGYFHPIVVLAVVQLGIHAATEPAGELSGDSSTSSWLGPSGGGRS